MRKAHEYVSPRCGGDPTTHIRKGTAMKKRPSRVAVGRTVRTQRRHSGTAEVLYRCFVDHRFFESFLRDPQAAIRNSRIKITVGEVKCILYCLKVPGTRRQLRECLKATKSISTGWCKAPPSFLR